MALKRKKKLKPYTITISRVSYGSREVKVNADSKVMAEKLAREMEGDFEYREHTVEYFTESVTIDKSYRK